jgi:type IV pilus assembly protein PilZ
MLTSAPGLSDQRRHDRAHVALPVEVELAGRDDKHPGRSRDLSLGGMFVETDFPLAFGAAIVVHVTLPGQRAAFALPGVVRWTRAEGMGVQFGMLGARETYAITELTRRGP